MLYFRHEMFKDAACTGGGKQGCIQKFCQGGIWIWTKEGEKEVFHPTHVRGRVTMTHPKYSSGKS